MAVAQQPSTELEVKKNTDLAVVDFGDDDGAGMEDVRREEYSIPFLYVLDAKSPACAPPTAGGTAGAVAGKLLNTATNELYDGALGAQFIPCMRDSNFGEWIPRNEDGSGGGFVGTRATNDPLVIELRAKHGSFGKLPTDNGTELVETFYLYGLIVNADGLGSPVLVPFKSTSISAYKNFVTRHMAIRYKKADGSLVAPPLWAHRWRIGTHYRPAKKAGQAGWYVPKLWLDEEPPVKSLVKRSDPLYEQAKALYTAIRAGSVAVNYEAASKQERVEDDVPF